ncbi:amino acid adenylation domain-containing protein [Brevibacterium sp. JNUCC-42]|nr:amino acid adenylation domain-containing protein [Brevibacterium sp. JNUCC-42]
MEKISSVIGLEEKIVYYPENKTIYHLFEEQAEKTPDQIAVICGDEQITYRELNNKSNSLSKVLVEKGVQSNQIIGILSERSITMVIGILAILKAGGAYLPIDPEYPTNRKNYMLFDSQVTLLLSEKDELVECLDYDGEIVYLNDKQINEGHSDLVSNRNKPNDLAYIIYTSGTTGKPKGVMIEHKAISNTIHWRRDEYKLGTDDKVIQLFSFSFDGFVVSLFTPLVSGATVILLKEYEAKDPLAIKHCIAAHQISYLLIVPSLYTFVLEVLTDEDAHSLRMITLAGEKMGPSHVVKSKEKNPAVEIINEYGPTENSVTTTLCRDVSVERINSIGTPIANNKVYIVDEKNEALPVGVPGELCVSGSGLARGYVNAPELTAEKFIDHPFEPGNKMYKTGDLAKWLPDGSLAYLGRVDNQVKVRGYRIELNEIEAHLLQYESIHEAVVTIWEDKDGSKHLCAYLVTNSNVCPDQLREYLTKRMPEYMVPSFFVAMERFPFTLNGKVDKCALPDPKINRISTEYVAPTGETEEKLIEIWKNVLDLGKVGMKDNFFHLGGHSLKAAVLITKIQKAFQVEFPLREVFQHATVEEQAHYLRLAQKVSYANIEKVAEMDYYPSSPAQKRLFVVNQLEGIGTSYNNPIFIDFVHDLSVSKLEETLYELVQRHESLRTSFGVVQGEIVQTIHTKVDFKLEYIEAPEEDMEEIRNNFVRPFDLGSAPLFRACLVKNGVNKFKLIMDTHHIVTDGVSMKIFMDECSQLLNGEQLHPLPIHYKDYTDWQNNLLHSEIMKEQEKYWLKTFEGKCPVLNFPTDYQRLKQLSFVGNKLAFTIEKQLADKCKQLSGEGNTLYMVLLAAYYTLLYKYTGQEDIIVGSPTAGRTHDDTNGIIGMFVNTLPIRNFPEGTKTFEEFLHEVKTNTLLALENQSYQLDTLIERLGVKRDISRNPLFDTVFSFRNMDKLVLKIDGTDYCVRDLDTHASKFDMTFYITDVQDSITWHIEYNTNLFKEETINRLAQHYVNVLMEIVKNPDQKLADIQLLTEEEKDQMMIEQWNQAQASYPTDKTIHQIIEEQVRKTPDRVAVAFEESQLTYRELNEKANSLARTLRKKDVTPDSFVAIMMERSLEMIVGIVAILKSGGAYLPIDPEYPQERIDYTLQNSEAKYLLTQEQLINKIKFDGEIINVNDSESYHHDVSDLECVNTPNDLAYMIYTSGSTGKPKGVLIEHRNVVRLLINSKFPYDFTENDVWPMFHSFCFDVSVWEMYGSLFYGGKLVVVPRIVAQNTAAFAELLRKEKITVLNQTPTAFYALLKEELSSQTKDLTVRYVIFAGEALSPKKLKEWKEKYPNCRCINMYGITETTVHTTFKEITSLEIETNVSNVGKPLPTLTCFLFDQYKKLVPVGVVGEIYVGGDGVARGYHGLEELTKERFIQNPYNPQERLYKSGDLARFLSNGEMEYLGRIDHQVKIRGYRIELGEIESRLLKHPSIKEAAVMAKEDGAGEKYLCAYFTASEQITIFQLREHVSKELPSYMVPAIFLQLESWSMTSNGKLDRKALPEPNETTAVGGTYVPPGNPLEEKLTKIWEEVLGSNQVGVLDDFFEIGGHSLKATSLVYKINKELDADISFIDIYTNNTVKQLAELIANKDQVCRDDDLVLLKKGSSNNVIFFIHGGNGMVDTYAEMCRHGISDFNCLGIEIEKDERIGQKVFHLKEFAKRYVKIIKDAQSEGPYYIMGTCIGGTIAFEIVRQLEEMGEKEIYLALVSAAPPDKALVYEMDENILLEEEKKSILSLLSLLPETDIELDGKGIEEMWKRAMDDCLENKISLDQIIAYINEDVPESKKNDLKTYLKAVNSVRALCSLRDRYIPSSSIKTRVSYYGGSEYDIVNKHLWENYCQTPIDYFVVPGDHFTIFKEPNVGGFAEVVSQHVELFSKQLA